MSQSSKKGLYMCRMKFIITIRSNHTILIKESLEDTTEDMSKDINQRKNLQFVIHVAWVYLAFCF